MKNKTQTTQPNTAMAVAACSIELSGAGKEIQLIPAGQFRARDGRPTNAPFWFLDAALARTLIASASARATPYVIDYEHQTLKAASNGRPAPASGWFRTLEWREGQGLFAVDVEWTATCQAMIAAKEYKFISPVFSYDLSGAVTGLLMAAVTNNPAIDGMDEVMLAAASLQYASHIASLSQTQELPNMDELLEKLRWLLNIPIASTAADILAELGKLSAAITAGQTTEAAASCDLVGLLAAQRDMIASLSTAAPDPSQYVAIGTMTSLQHQVAQLSTELATERMDGLIGGAIAAGKLLPSMEGWARDLGAKNIAALNSYIANAPPIALLDGLQTGGKEPAVAPTGALTSSQVALCTAMGITEDDYLATLQAETRP